MNTAALKTFAIRARNLLMEGVSLRLGYWGFSEKGGTPTETVQAAQGGYIFRGKVYDEADVPQRWSALREAIAATSFKEMCEKAAYTWFNRLMALAILEHNGYEQPQLQYLGDATVPAMLERARRGQHSYLKPQEAARLQPLLADYTRETEAFAGLIVAYCHHHRLLHALFGAVADYTELLLPADMLETGGFLHLLNTSDAFIETGEDGKPDRTAAFRKAELIGWLYQFYIAQRKDEVFAGFKKNIKASAADIPAATQIFTPAWIVKYMVQNTVGRTWLEMHPDTPQAEGWKYLVRNEQNVAANPKSEIRIPESLESLNFADLAAGSGHILTEAFDLFYECYMEEGYTAREAVESILTHNLFGLDLDPRAAGLARFAVMLKAAKRHRDILATGPLPHIYAAPPHKMFNSDEVSRFLGADGAAHRANLSAALKELDEAYNLGSIVQVTLTAEAREYVAAQTAAWEARTLADLEDIAVWQKMAPYLRMLNILATSYWCLAANPPYMGQKNMNGQLKQYVNAYYPDTKSDLFAVFMDVIMNHTKKGGFYSIINLPSWLFLSSFIELRERLLTKYSIESMLHMGRGIFGIDFGSVAFTCRRENPENRKGIYFRLHERTFQHIYYEDIGKLFLYSKYGLEYKYDFGLYRDEGGVNEIPEKGTVSGQKLVYSSILQQNFSKIPGSPIAYWITDNFRNAFSSSKLLGDVFDIRAGITTADNETFVRFWYEVRNKNICFDAGKVEDVWNQSKKWVPYNKGGSYQKWFGNNDFVIAFDRVNYNILLNQGNHLPSRQYYFRKCATWSDVSAGDFVCRFSPAGFVFDVKGSSGFTEFDLLYFIGLLNSRVMTIALNVLNPTMSFQTGNIKALPFRENDEKAVVEYKVDNCIRISRSDWDTRETSWDFQISPLIATVRPNVASAYAAWREEASRQFYTLHAHEEELNRIFIGIYGLEDEITPEVPLKDITILQDELDWKSANGEISVVAGKQPALPIRQDVVMQQLISYAVGCAMGRYRLDKPGLHIAHPSPTAEELAEYTVPAHSGLPATKFTIDEDAIIPLMGAACSFRDDAARRLSAFLAAVWGEDTLTANLNFIADGLGCTPEEYLVKSFWKAHCRTYSKKPIYWLFTSPNGAFQVLVYMHRLSKFTVTKIRNKYLQPHIAWLRQRIKESDGATDKQSMKAAEKLRRDLADCEHYDGLLNSPKWEFEIDLDNGLTRNYALYRGIVAEIK